MTLPGTEVRLLNTRYRVQHCGARLAVTTHSERLHKKALIESVLVDASMVMSPIPFRFMDTYSIHQEGWGRRLMPTGPPPGPQLPLVWLFFAAGRATAAHSDGVSTFSNNVECRITYEYMCVHPRSTRSGVTVLADRVKPMVSRWGSGSVSRVRLDLGPWR